MNRIDSKKSNVMENLGWLDRLIRFVLGITFISVAATYLFIADTTPAWLKDGAPQVWPYYLMIIAVYPFITAILGRDPFYGFFKIKSCDTSERNVCGTFPFEVDAAMGHKPVPDSDIEHSLSMSHHVKPQKSKGK